MTEFFIVLEVVFLVLILLAAIGICIAAFKGAALDKESKAYVEAALPVAISSWNTKELLSRASPQLTQVTSADDVERCIRVFAYSAKCKRVKVRRANPSLDRF